MHHTKQPGARFPSDRAGDFVLGGTLPHTTPHHEPLRRYVEAWRVNRWLGVDRVEVRRA